MDGSHTNQDLSIEKRLISECSNEAYSQDLSEDSISQNAEDATCDESVHKSLFNSNYSSIHINEADQSYLLSETRLHPTTINHLNKVSTKPLYSTIPIPFTRKSEKNEAIKCIMAPCVQKSVKYSVKSYNFEEDRKVLEYQTLTQSSIQNGANSKPLLSENILNDQIKQKTVSFKLLYTLACFTFLVNPFFGCYSLIYANRCSEVDDYYYGNKSSKISYFISITGILCSVCVGVPLALYFLR